MKRKKVGRKAKKWGKEVEKLRKQFAMDPGGPHSKHILRKLTKANNAYFSALEGTRYTR